MTDGTLVKLFVYLILILDLGQMLATSHKVFQRHTYGKS